MANSDLPSSEKDQIAECLQGANTLFCSGDVEGAFAILHELRGMFPNNSDVYGAIIRQYASVGDMETVNVFYQELFALAGKMMADGDFDAAIKTYKEVNRIFPQEVAYANLAFLRTTKARRIFAES